MMTIKPLILVFLFTLTSCASNYDNQVGYGVATVQQSEASPEYFDKSPLFFGKVNGPVLIEFELEEPNVYTILGAGGHVAGWAVFEDDGLIRIVNLEGKTTNILHQDKEGVYHIYDVDGTYLGVMGFEEGEKDHYYLAGANGDPLGRVSAPVWPVYNPYGYYDSWGRYNGLGYGYGNPIWGNWGYGTRGGYYRNQKKDNHNNEPTPTDETDVANNDTPTKDRNNKGDAVFDEMDFYGDDQLQQRPMWQKDPRPKSQKLGNSRQPRQVWRLNENNLKEFDIDRSQSLPQKRTLNSGVTRPRLRDVSQKRPERTLSPATDSSGYRPQSLPRPQQNPVPNYQPRKYDSPQSRPQNTSRPQQTRPRNTSRPTPVPRPRAQPPRQRNGQKSRPVIRENNN